MFFWQDLKPTEDLEQRMIRGEIRKQREFVVELKYLITQDSQYE